MGMGDFGAGETLAGEDNQSPTERAARQAPSALAFDGLKRDFELDANGLYVAAHPVDAKVFLILRTAIGSIRSAITTGQGVSNLRYIEKASIQKTVEDLVSRALASTIAAGEISGVTTEVDASVRGRVMFRVSYFNMVSRRRVGPLPFSI